MAQKRRGEEAPRVTWNWVWVDSHIEVRTEDGAPCPAQPPVRTADRPWTVVCRAPYGWSDTLPTRTHHLMRQFAQHGHTVWYLPGSPGQQPDEPVGPNLTVVHDTERFLASANQLPRPLLVWAAWPLGLRLPEQIRPDRIVLDMGCGLVSGMPVRPELLERVDLVLTGSTGEMERLSRQAPQALIRLLPNGAQFAPATSDQPQTTGRVRLGVVGSLGYWLDTSLIEQVSAALPEAELELLPVPSVLYGGVALRLPALPNIRLRRERPPAALPERLSGLNALLLPWSPNPVSATTPLTLCDLLSTGVPVVTLTDPEGIDLRPLVYAAETPAAFLTAVREALAEEGRHAPARRELARRSSWAQRYGELTKMLQLETEDH